MIKELWNVIFKNKKLVKIIRVRNIKGSENF